MLLASMAAKISSWPDKPGREGPSNEAGGIDEVCECATAAFVLSSPITIVEVTMPEKVVETEEDGVVVGASASNTLPPPTKRGSEKMSDDNGGIQEVCRRSTTAFALPFGKPRSGTVPDVGLVLKPLHDAVTECAGALVTADEMRAKLESPNKAVGTLEDAGLMSALCPD